MFSVIFSVTCTLYMDKCIPDDYNQKINLLSYFFWLFLDYNGNCVILKLCVCDILMLNMNLQYKCIV